MTAPIFSYKTKEPPYAVLMFCQTGSCVLLDDFLAVVASASLADTMCESVLTTLRALYHAGKIKLPDIGTSFISASFRYFSLRYCHLPTPP